MELWTIQMGKWRLAKAAEIELVDITHKSGIRQFAPDPDFLYAYKRGDIDAATYTGLYMDKIAHCRVFNEEMWNVFIGKEKLAIACYCAPGAFCHRLLLAPIIGEYLRRNGIPVSFMGELT